MIVDLDLGYLVIYLYIYRVLELITMNASKSITKWQMKNVF